MQFGRLTVIEDSGERSKDGSILWKCQCSCTNKTITYVITNKLTGGWTKSCGCIRKENSKSSLIKKAKYPNDNRTRLFSIWKGIIERVYNENSISYKYYGERGITICDEWKNDFFTFKNWALNNGYSENLTIDRIDVDGNYEPINCKWSTAKEQANNRTNTVLLTYNNLSLTINEWSEKMNLNPNTIRSRMDKGWTVEEILTNPIKCEPIVLVYNGEKKTVSEWSDYTGIDKSILKNRYSRGWSTEKILTTEPIKDRNIKLEYNGVIRTIEDWSKILGIKKKTLWARYNRGWSIERVLTTPVKN